MVFRSIVYAAFLFIGGAVSCPAAFADTYPSKPIRLVIPWTAGAGVDITGRRVAQKLGEALGQTIIVDNRGGASGTIGSAAVARDAPDGYTLIVGNSASHGSAKAVYPKLPYDPANDFTPVSLIYRNRLVLAVTRDFPANTLAELVKYAKENPGKVSYGTPGEGSPHLLAGETLKRRAGIEMIHVPYKGGGQVMNDLVAGHIQAAVSAVSAALDMQRNGRIKILAVMDQHRIDSLPGVPSVAETYPGFDIAGWGGLFGPRNLPQPIVKKLGDAMRTVMTSAELKATFEASGAVPETSTPEELKKMVTEEGERWQEIVRQPGK
jgi:tripartite-type tricarboxylate transporter receptor subunit TctC